MLKAKDLEKSLTVNKDLIGKKIKSINDNLNLIKDLVNDDKIQLKEQLRIQEDRS